MSSISGIGSVEEALGNKISDSDHRIGIAMMGHLMVDFSGGWERVQFGLGSPKMVHHVGPGFFNSWTTITLAEGLGKDWFLGEDDVGEV